MKKKKRKKKNFLQTTKQKIIQKYEHKHSVLFFALIFNLFIFTIILIVSAINYDLDLLSAKRILFNQPNPTILADVEEVVGDYPIKEMAPYIAREKRETAAFLVAIAKKESAWGTRTPKLNGEECYNYWGYRKKRERMGSGGHTCFDSPEDAVNTVAGRINRLIKQGVDTPREMVLWKCGNCTGPERIGSEKWIQDVALYYNKMMEEKNKD